MQKLSKSFQELVDQWPSPFVARGEVPRFSGGSYKSKSMANMDSLGVGPPRLKIGRRVVYRARDLAAWLQARSTACPPREA